MENKINKDDYEHIWSAILLHTRTLALIPEGIDLNGQLSISLLEKIISADDSVFIKQLSLTHSELVRKAGIKQTHWTENGHNITLDAIIWGRMIVISYYFYHEDKKWVKKGIPAMERYIYYSIIKDSIKRGMELVDDYYQQCKDWNDDDELAVTNTDLGKSPFYIAENRKTDVMKVLAYMYDLGLFADSQGQVLSHHKKQIMMAFGDFLNSDFEKYAQTINKAAQEPNFPSIFEDMLSMANDQYTDKYK